MKYTIIYGEYNNNKNYKVYLDKLDIDNTDNIEHYMKLHTNTYFDIWFVFKGWPEEA